MELKIESKYVYWTSLPLHKKGEKVEIFTLKKIEEDGVLLEVENEIELKYARHEGLVSFDVAFFKADFVKI